jgi:hypothetical protein
MTAVFEYQNVAHHRWQSSIKNSLTIEQADGLRQMIRAGG